MEQVTKQTSTQNTKVESNTAKTVVGIVFGAIEVLLAFRLVFKLFGASTGNAFVHGIYTFTHFFTAVFEGIFARANTTVGNAVATLVAMAVVALIAYVVLKLIKPKSGITVEHAEHTEANEVNE